MIIKFELKLIEVPIGQTDRKRLCCKKNNQVKKSDKFFFALFTKKNKVLEIFLLTHLNCNRLEEEVEEEKEEEVQSRIECKGQGL